jgi:hypothetical protein
MTNSNTSLSEPVVFPGHPLVIALIIMGRYANLAEALDEAGTGIARVLADPNVPGGAAFIDSAVSLLELGCSGTSIDDLVRHADAFWRDASPVNLQQGLQQAKDIETQFRERATVWCARQLSPAH